MSIRVDTHLGEQLSPTPDTNAPRTCCNDSQSVRRVAACGMRVAEVWHGRYMHAAAGKPQVRLCFVSTVWQCGSVAVHFSRLAPRFF